jgi:hypothetical protein
LYKYTVSRKFMQDTGGSGAFYGRRAAFIGQATLAGSLKGPEKFHLRTVAFYGAHAVLHLLAKQRAPARVLYWGGF